MLNDTTQRYGSMTRFFHWVVALLVLQQFLKYANRINEGEHWLGHTIIPWHSSVGAVILVLMVLRLWWALKQRGRRPVDGGALGALARLGHGAMYLCLLSLPFFGALYIHGKGYAVKLFGVEVLAKPAGEVDWALALGHLHSPLAILLTVLVVGHVAAAFYHHRIKKDDVLRRML